MSYILDALKKSEQERGHGSVPGVQTIHSSSINYHHDKKSTWPLLLVALVLINITVLVYFILTKDQTQTVAATQQQPDNNSVIASTQYSDDPNTLQERSVNPVAVADARQDTIPAQAANNYDEKNVDLPTMETRQAERSVEIVELYDIPLNVRQHIPAMEFSAHVYSTNAAQRSIVINGRFMEEGDPVTSDLILNEITSDGAIFDFQGYRFSASVLSGWNLNQ